MIVYHLSSGGQANTVTGDGLLAAAPGGPQPPDACYHDPFSPVPAGDRTILDVREDVLCYTGSALTGPVTPRGPGRLRLCLSSSAARAHLAIAILDVPAAGPAAVLGEAAAHVSGLSRRAVRTVEVTVPLRATVLDGRQPAAARAIPRPLRAVPGRGCPGRGPGVPRRPAALDAHHPGSAGRPRRPAGIR